MGEEQVEQEDEEVAAQHLINHPKTVVNRVTANKIIEMEGGGLNIILLQK